MTSKGKQYSTIVRRAGLAWGKGDLPKAIVALQEWNEQHAERLLEAANEAIAALQEGIALATENGDAAFVQVLQQDLERYQRAAAGEELDLAP